MCQQQVNRWYWKCADCLRVAVATEQLGKVQCGACGGSMACMGQVMGARLGRNEVRCACDARCTGALGPNCECSCGGVNHGTGAVVSVVRDLGPIPVLSGGSGPKCRAIAAEYRAAREVVLGEYQAINARRRAGWIEQAAYARWCLLGRILSKASESKSHAGRMKILRSVLVVNV